MTTYARPRFGPMVDPLREQTEKELGYIQQQFAPRMNLDDIVAAMRDAKRSGDEEAFVNAQQEAFRYGFTIEELPPDLQAEMTDPVESPETGPGIMMGRKFMSEDEPQDI